MDTTLIIVLVIALVVLGGAAAYVATSRRTGRPQDTARPVAPTVPTRPVGLRERLTRSRSAIVSSLGGVFAASRLDDGVWEDIEDALLAADVGPQATDRIVAGVRDRHPVTGEQARLALEAELDDLLDRSDRDLHLAGSPAVVVVVGVNGTGKTTSIAKIANRLVGSERRVILAAADTFRAGADAQLRTWGDRVGVPVVSGDPGSDPASVAYEAYARAVREGVDTVIVDTAGRLHSRANLMDELGKIVRVLAREAGSIDEVLLVLDGTVGQNGIAQARAFTDAVGVSGIVLTKLDGTARGGVAVAIEQELDIPVKLIGVGEGMDDLVPFVPEEFVAALIAE